MKINTNKPVLFFSFGIIILLLLAVFVYYVYLLPLNSEVDRKKTELQMAEQQVDILETKIKTTGTATNTNTIELQKRVPVKRLLEQALLELEKAEIISDTNIMEIKINGTDADEAVTDDELTTADKAIDEANKQDEDTSDKEETKEEIILPNGIHKTSINILGEAPTYFELEEFIDKIQSATRIMTIDSLNITGPKEIMSIEDNDQVIDFELTLSIYYYPALNDLIEDLPPLETPKVSERKNPFDSGSLDNTEEVEEP